ncbi:MAG TPA: class I SAM-dependent methyltransferase [Methanomicrobiales archaeon]|nr:class I SAM-dependent methyltransferase [Methanomicrobiales archaeon]
MDQNKEPIINQIERMVSDIPGWSPIDQLYSLFLLVYSNSHLEGDIVEIGSWCGRSTAVLGLAAWMTGVKKVISIDLFPNKSDWIQNPDGTYSFRVKYENEEFSAYTEQTVWKEPYEQSILPVYEKNENLYSLFLENMSKLGFEDLVIPIKGNSSALQKIVVPSFKCKLAFIDGDHGYDAVCKDIDNVERYLVPGAWICFDDAFSSYEGINRAIQDRIIDCEDYVCGQQMTRKFFVARKK